MVHKEYAVYKGDNLIAMGTRQEIADELNVKLETVTYWGTPTNIKRIAARKSTRNAKVLVKLGKPEEE